jgi:hypothetical protein
MVTERVPPLDTAESSGGTVEVQLLVERVGSQTLRSCCYTAESALVVVEAVVEQVAFVAVMVEVYEQWLLELEKDHASIPSGPLPTLVPEAVVPSAEAGPEHSA